MLVEAQVAIAGSRAAAWAAIADIENGAKVMSGIKKIEVVHKPANGLVGLKWRETRILFDEPATVEKWITEATENDSYTTRAESHGFVFLTTFRISGSDGALVLASSHDSQPQRLAAKLQTIPMALFFKGTIRKAILKDLADIKAAVERPQ